MLQPNDPLDAPKGCAYTILAGLVIWATIMTLIKLAQPVITF